MADLDPRLVTLIILQETAQAMADQWKDFPPVWRVYSARALAFSECIALLADVESEASDPAPGVSDPAPEIAPTQTGVQ